MLQEQQHTAVDKIGLLMMLRNALVHCSLRHVSSGKQLISANHPVHMFIFCFCKILVNVILPSHLGLSNTHFVCLSHRFHRSQLNHANIVW